MGSGAGADIDPRVAAMKLIELDPHWFALESGGPIVGITFLCPHCRLERIGVAFHHLGREAMEDQYIKAHSPSTGHIWSATGADFASLSLSPSIDASNAGHWHGFVTNGEVT